MKDTQNILIYQFRIKAKLYCTCEVSDEKHLFQNDFQLQRFASSDEGRTELPSERRKREERQRGNVPRSQEIVSASVLLGGVLALFAMGLYMYSTAKKIFYNYLQWDFSDTKDISEISNLRIFTIDLGLEVAKIVGPVLLIVVIIAIISNVSQFGLLFSLHPLGMRLEKIRPDFKRVLPSKRTLFNIARILLQLILIGMAAYFVIVNNYISMFKTANFELGQAISLFAMIALKLLIVASIVLGIVSIPDFIYQRHEYLEKLKVTLSESKRERKDDEGAPLIRQRQRDRAYELRKQRNILQDTTTADVIITNPTHFAVGLKYSPESNQAPIVVTKGADHLAYLIRNIAKEHDIPIEENPPLARSLYEEIDIGYEIPETLYRVVSLIFSRLDRFRNAELSHAK